MGYPKYDKEEAKRVYDEALSKATGTTPDERRETNRFLFWIVLCSIAFFSVIFYAVYDDMKKNETIIVTTREDVVITSFRLRSSRGKKFIVSYYTLNEWKHGEYETEVINFVIGDTTTIEIKREEKK